jgi:hypothetical protein
MPLVFKEILLYRGEPRSLSLPGYAECIIYEWNNDVFSIYLDLHRYNSINEGKANTLRSDILNGRL